MENSDANNNFDKAIPEKAFNSSQQIYKYMPFICMVHCCDDCADNVIMQEDEELS